MTTALRITSPSWAAGLIVGNLGLLLCAVVLARWDKSDADVRAYCQQRGWAWTDEPSH